MRRTIPYHFDVTTPPGTTKATPLVTLCQIPQGIVRRIEWIFPGGCAGNVGMQLGARSITIFPQPSTAFIVRSGSAGEYELEGLHNTGDWSVITYNTGQFPHTIQVTFFHGAFETAPELDRMFTDLDRMTMLGAS